MIATSRGPRRLARAGALESALRMAGRVSKTELIYRMLMERVLSGALAPGARIDANEIAAADGVSPTPVRNALNRLVGAGLIVSHSNEGFFAPSLTELGLRDLYEGCDAMLTLAVAVAGAAAGRKQAKRAAIRDANAAGTIALETEMTFEAIMSLGANRRLSGAFAQLNISLRPVRLLEGEQISNQGAELRRLRHAYEALDLSALEKLIRAYHRRRVPLAPMLIARLHERERAAVAADLSNAAEPR